METAQYVQGLREIAQFYEDHPEIKLPYEGIDCCFSIFHATKDEMVAGVHAFGKAEKKFDKYNPDVFELRKTFPSGLALRFWSNRETVCERIVVGIKVEPAHIIPSKFEPEVFVPEREIEQVEWKCGSLLAPGEVNAEV